MPSPAKNGTVNDYESEEALLEALSKCQTCAELDWKVANLQEETSEKESLAAELERLQILRSYRILDTDRRPSFERLTALAARIFDVKICLVSLVDLGRQWFASNRGLGEVRETPRKAAFCAHAILSKLDLFIVNDTFEDSRFKNNPLVTGDPKIRFYAGSPLVTPEGYKLGTFCIIDTKPRPNGLTLDDKQNLREIAALVMEQLNEQKLEYERSKSDHSRQIACTSHDLITPLTSIQLNMGLIMEDQELRSLMTRSQRETMRHTRECVDIMSNICLQSIRKFRGVPLGETDLENHESGSLNIKNLIESIQHVMAAYPKRAALNFRVDDDVPQVIQGDVLAVFRSSLNFLTNACKVSESGVVDFHISMTEESIATQAAEEDSNTTAHRKYMMVECTDSGPGIQNEKVKELFTADGGLRLSQGSDIGGLGLGLYSVSELISGCGGSFGYRPCVDNNGEIFGSVFWFKVPAIEKLDGNVVNSLLKGLSCARDIEMAADADLLQHPTSTMDTFTGLVDDACNSIEKVNIEEMEDTRIASIVTPITESNDDKQMIDIEMKKPNEHVNREKPSEQFQGQKPMEEVVAKLKKSSPQVEKSKRKVSETDPETITECSDSKKMKRKKCALVIDDSKVIRKVLHRALTNMGFEVKLAENGLQGLNEMKNTVFDIVLCDFLMPIMDGMDCVKQYREWEKSNREWFDQYIVGISAHADESDGNRGLDVGMNKFIPKPLPMKVLKGLLDSDEIQKISDKIDQLEESEKHLLYLVNPLEVGSHSTASSVSGDEAEPERTCLLVEDTRSIAKAMMRCIERNGWKCVTVGDGEQALNLMKMRNWDCVFMDDELPVMHGTTCMAHFREWEKQNRVARQNNVYICSAGVIDSSSPPCGFDGVFSKPFKPSSLNNILKHCMAGGSQASLL